MKICSIQYELSLLSSWSEYEKKITGLIEKGSSQRAEIVVFPEYASMELTALLSVQDTQSQLETMQALLSSYLDLFCKLSASYKLHICSGSFPVKTGNKFRNRSYFFTPSRGFDFQDKLYLTRFEKETNCIESGDELKVFHTAIGNIAINVCYDSEFPLCARKQVEQGAQILLVPSCTDSSTGYHRVFLSCRARALENQCYVVQSPLIGKLESSDYVDINYGYAGIFSPVDIGFPHDGILAKCTSKQMEIASADLVLEALETVRKNGQVLNHQDWKQCDLSNKTCRSVHLI
jgi:predicted amidohydrolase